MMQMSRSDVYYLLDYQFVTFVNTCIQLFVFLDFSKVENYN